MRTSPATPIVCAGCGLVGASEGMQRYLLAHGVACLVILRSTKSSNLARNRREVLSCATCESVAEINKVHTTNLSLDSQFYHLE